MILQVELPYGKRFFSVDVEFSDCRRLSITVHPDCRVTARAPLGYGADIVKSRLEGRASWVARQVCFFEQFMPLPIERKFVSGETHYYLGRQYRLRIRTGEPARVRLVGSFFEMELPEPANRAKAKVQMQDWYTAHAKDLLRKRLDLHYPLFSRMGAPVPMVSYRRMTKRWGSCSALGAITLNTELVKAPLHCVDYVIVHELCHLLCQRHDHRFFRLLGRVMPDWEKRKKRLESFAL